MCYEPDIYVVNISYFQSCPFWISKLHSAESCPDVSLRCNGCPLCQRLLSFAYEVIRCKIRSPKVCKSIVCEFATLDQRLKFSQNSHLSTYVHTNVFCKSFLQYVRPFVQTRFAYMTIQNEPWPGSGQRVLAFKMCKGHCLEACPAITDHKLLHLIHAAQLACNPTCFSILLTLYLSARDVGRRLTSLLQ